METYEVFCPSPTQFQQPSRLLHDEYDSEIDIGEAENGFRCQHLDRLEKKSKTHESEEDEDDSLEMLKGLLKEVDVKGHEMLRKFVGRVDEKEVPMERVWRETLHEFRGKPGLDMLEKIARKLNRGGEEGFVVAERGDILQEASMEKLERFKVKTVNAIGAGVVKEEGQ